MKQSKLEQPQFKKQFIQELAIGATKTDIAKEVGLSRSTVSRFSSREDIRELVRSETCNLLEVLPDAVENVKNLVREMRQNPKQQFKDKELSYKASLRVLEAVSILSSPSPSLQVINIVKENQNEVPSVIQKLLNEIAQKDMAGGMLADDAEK